MIRKFSIAMVLLGLAILCASRGLAASVPTIQAVATLTGDKVTGQLRINGRPVANLLTPNGKLSPMKRAEIAAERLTTMVTSESRPWKVSAAIINKKPCIACGETVILVCTKAEARAHGVAREQLAELWAQAMQKMLDMPALAVKPGSLVIPLGEQRTVTTSGYLDSLLKAFDASQGVTQSAVDPENRCVIVRGTAVGSSSVTIKCGDEALQIPVEVKKYAGKLGPTPVMTITGRPAPREWIMRAVRSAASQGAIPEQGADFRVVSIDAPKTLGAGKEAEVEAKLAFSGKDYLPIEVSGRVRVRNLSLPIQNPSRLLYSNDPERILRHGTLFAGQLVPGESERLFYHHQNDMNQPVLFVTEVMNPGNTPAQLQVIEGATPPQIDTIEVGFNAGRNYLERAVADVGYVTDLPPASSVRLVGQWLPHRYTTSGIFGLRQLSGSPLIVVVQAAGEGWSARDLPTPISMSQSVFPNPAKTVSASYTVGGPWAFVRVGKHAITDGTEENRQLDGNYGVMYTLDIDVKNPTMNRRKIEVLFEATAGVSRAIFLNGSQMITIPMTDQPREEPVLSFSLGPGQSRHFFLRTMPLGGSSYPATVIVRSPY